MCDECFLLGESGRNRNYLEHFAFYLSLDTPVVAFWGFMLCLMLFFNKHRLLSAFLFVQHMDSGFQCWVLIGFEDAELQYVPSVL